MAWSRRADLGGEGTTRAMHRPHNMVALGPQGLWAAGEGPNKLGSAPAWAKPTQDSRATDRRQLSDWRGAPQAKQRITIEEGGASGKDTKVFSKRGSLPGREYDNWRQAALGVRYRSAVIGIKARKSRLGGAQQSQTGNPSKSYTSASGQEIQSQSCQGQP